MKRGLWTLLAVWAAVAAASQPKPTAPPTEPTNTTAPSAPTTGPTTATTESTPTTGPTNTTTGATKTTTVPTNTTTTSPPTTAPTNTTTGATNTTTVPTNTTTTSPPTTAPTNTTTVPTNTTTPSPPTPGPPMPTPVANLTAGDYALKGPKGETCLRAAMALQIRLESAKANGTFIVQPLMTEAKGDCQDATANLTLKFREGAVTFLYNKNATENRFYVTALSFRLTYPLIPGGRSYSASNRSLNLFSARIGHSYSCKRDSLPMGNGLHLDVTQDRMQVFGFANSQDFGSADLCAADKPDYSVAIGVGITLLVLIIIVVVVYLVGRRRRSSGYQSL